ncbi:hypothetical protein Dimus_016633 [Dionaea muscipula]
MSSLDAGDTPATVVGERDAPYPARLGSSECSRGGELGGEGLFAGGDEDPASWSTGGRLRAAGSASVGGGRGGDELLVNARDGEVDPEA